MANILLPHRKQTVRRMKGQPVVLCIQDGGDLNFNNLSKCEGLREIGNNQTGAKSKGLHLHSMTAITPDGIPLGVMRAQCSAPKLKDTDDKRRAREIPIEEKKTFSCIAYKTAERLKRALAINLVIAWRIMLMALLGRNAPALPAEVLFSDLEIEVLNAYAKKKALPTK